MKQLTAENKLDLVFQINNGIINTKLTKSVMQEVMNLQHCIINNIINPEVRTTNELNDLCYLFNGVCNMLEQPGKYDGSYRNIFNDNYFVTTGIPDNAKIRLVRERNDLYCHVSDKLTDKDKWEIAQGVRVLIKLISYWRG
jgi:hypothetical protein